MHAAGVTIRGERPEVSAVRTYDEFEGKARQMCGGGAPVVFTAVDWGLPRLVTSPGGASEDAELIFSVHTGHRVAIRLAREKAARLHEALGLTLGVPAAAPAQPPGAPVAARAHRVYSKITAADVERAYAYLVEHGGTFAACVRAMGHNANSLDYRMRAAYGADFIERAARERAARQPLLKPNGKIL
jgi:hypothetical protein